jgi:ADP-ribose pyrophosphatase YjhB (NUDIX family)
MGNKNAHCSYCGRAFAADAPFPRVCEGCSATTYVNPLPVAIVLLPIDGDGLLAIRRAIEPRRGQLALPGGVISMGESWQQAGARELYEETGIVIDAEGIEDFRVLSAPDGTVLVFGLARPMRAAELPTFMPTDETSERVILRAPQPLGFPLHTRVVEQYFAAPRRDAS